MVKRCYQREVLVVLDGRGDLLDDRLERLLAFNRDETVLWSGAIHARG